MRKIEEKTSTYFTEESAHICFNENNKERGNNLIDQAKQVHISEESANICFNENNKERGNNLIDQAKQVHILQRKVLIYVLMKTTKREVTI